MARLKINGVEVEVGSDATVLDAARATHCEIPTLCHCREIGPLTACMVCVVKDAATGKTLPACSARALDGMDIITEDADLSSLRRGTLRLFLEEHAGDCEGPCTRACPAGLNTPRMLRRLHQGDLHGAAAIAREDLLFPALLGRVCAAPCERVCRRAQYDRAISIRDIHGRLGEAYPDAIPTPLPPTGKSVAIVGTGLAGLAATCVSARNGHACHLYGRESRLAAALRGQAPDTLFDADLGFLESYGVEMHLGMEMPQPIAEAGGISNILEELLDRHDAVILVADDPLTDAAPHLYSVKEEKMPVRAVAAGKRVASEMNATLLGLPFNSRRSFNSKLGPIENDELDAYAVERKIPDALADTEEDGGSSAMEQEAGRCLHCDCLKPQGCKLRQYAEAYDVRLSVSRTLSRPKIAPIERHGTILYEPGKCIKCGICIEITRKRGIRPGMTFTGRGIRSRVRGALGALLSDALGAAADACVEACPTGALAHKHTEE